MSTYYKISAEEMQNTMSTIGFRRVGDVEACEEVYEFEHPKYPGMGIRVYSSIDEDTGVARKKGKDAIRCLYWSFDHDRSLGVTKRIHRIDTWEKNLMRRLRLMAGMLGAMRDIECPKCGGLMARRKGRLGPFYGCMSYPTCNGTRQVTEVDPILHEREEAVREHLKSR